MTFETQKKAQVQRQTLEKETAIADMQAEVVRADQGVQIAERHADASVKKAKGDAESIKISASANAEAIKLKAEADAKKTSLIGQAEADATLAKGKADAESYRLAVEAMGQENFTTFKVTEEIGKNGVKIMPDMLIGGQGGSGGAIDGLLGLQILDMMGKKVNAEVKDIPSEEVKQEKGKK